MATDPESAPDGKPPTPEEKPKAPKTTASAPDAGGASSLRSYLASRPDPLTGLVLTLPVFLIYHLGLLAIDLRNGVDWVTSLTLQLLENKLAYAGVTLGLGALLVGITWLLRRTGRLKTKHTPRSQAPWLILESVLLALLMSFSVGWATGQVFQSVADTGLQAGPPLHRLSFIEKLVLSAGAGFHEELVFRVILFAGGSWVLARLLPQLGARKEKAPAAVALDAMEPGKPAEKNKKAGFWAPIGWMAVLMTAVVSSLLFAGVHYLGPLGDPFTVSSFFFRWLGGLYLCAVFRYRGFPVAVWTHFLYDLFVFFF